MLTMGLWKFCRAEYFLIVWHGSGTCMLLLDSTPGARVPICHQCTAIYACLTSQNWREIWLRISPQTHLEIIGMLCFLWRRYTPSSAGHTSSFMKSKMRFPLSQNKHLILFFSKNIIYLILRELSKSWDSMLQNNLPENGTFFQGDRSEDFGLNDDLADSDARVSKGLQALLELTFLVG